MKIEKKVWPVYFEKILSGEKNYELRLGDFECNTGDILVLKEWNPETKEYTGRVIEKTSACLLYNARTKSESATARGFS